MDLEDKGKEENTNIKQERQNEEYNMEYEDLGREHENEAKRVKRSASSFFMSISSCRKIWIPLLILAIVAVISVGVSYFTNYAFDKYIVEKNIKAQIKHMSSEMTMEEFEITPEITGKVDEGEKIKKKSGNDCYYLTSNTSTTDSVDFYFPGSGAYSNYEYLVGYKGHQMDITDKTIVVINCEDKSVDEVITIMKQALDNLNVDVDQTDINAVAWSKGGNSMLEVLSTEYGANLIDQAVSCDGQIPKSGLDYELLSQTPIAFVTASHKDITKDLVKKVTEENPDWNATIITDSPWGHLSILKAYRDKGIQTWLSLTPSKPDEDNTFVSNEDKTFEDILNNSLGKTLKDLINVIKVLAESVKNGFRNLLELQSDDDFTSSGREAALEAANNQDTSRGQ